MRFSKVGLGLAVFLLLGTGAFATPIDTETLGDHTVDLVSANVFDGTFYVWTYQVTSGSSPAISHWGLSVCLDIFDHADGNYELRTTPDSHLGILGIKFEDGFADGEVRTVNIYLTAEAAILEGDVGVKAGRDKVWGTIDSPQCGTGEIPEPTTMALIGAGILGLASKRKRLI